MEIVNQLKGCCKARIELANHFMHGFPMIFVAVNERFQVFEEIGFFVAVQIVVEQ